MNRSFTISGRYHPAYSLLGRWIRRRSADRRSAQSTYLVAAATVGVALMVSQFLAWSYLQPMPDSVQTSFYVVQVVLAAAYAGVVLAGREPAVRVHLADDELRIERDDEALLIPLAEIRRVAIISAETYYGHYARYAATQDFVNRIHPTLLMLELPGRPVILGLEAAQRVEIERLLTERAAAPYAPPHVGAA